MPLQPTQPTFAARRSCTLVMLLLYSTAFAFVVEANAPCRAPGGGFSRNTQLQRTAIQAESEFAPTCFDGTPATYYYRPCCDGQDPLDFCNASATANWFIIFESNGWCFSDESCRARPRAYTSSASLPDLFPQSLDGIFSIAGEQNPNFYKNYAVFVPHCSNDMFLASCHTDENGQAEAGKRDADGHFCGQDIARRVVSDLVPELEKYGHANVVFVGGAGLMSLVPELALLLPQNATPAAVCDGCLLLDEEPLVSPASTKHCSSDNCSVNITLFNPRTASFWNSTRTINIDGLRPQALISSLANVNIPMVAIQPLNDNITLSRLGAWSNNGTRNKVAKWNRHDPESLGNDFIARVANKTAGLLETAPYAFGAACTGPHGQSLLDSYTTFSTRVPHAGGFPFALSNLLYDLLRNPETNFSRAVDTCRSKSCNPTCNVDGL